VLCSSNPDLPFGGKGPSGMGAYHGKAGFDTFTHQRSTLEHDTWLNPDKRYPPYDDKDIVLLTRILVGPFFSPEQKMALGMVAAAVVGGLALKARM